MGEQRLKNITDPVIAYRVRLELGVSLPPKRLTEGERLFSLSKRLRRAVSPRYSLFVVGTTLVILATVVFLRHGPEPPDIRPQAVVVRPPTVLKVDPQHAWMPAAMSVYLNSQLSRVPDLKVYPEEHFNFLVQQSNSSYMEVARQLGITKVIRGTFLEEENALRLEIHLEDVRNIIHEPSEEVQGKQEEFFNLIQDLTVKITRRLDLQFVKRPSVPPSASDAFRLMMEGEGEFPLAPSQQEAPSPQGSPQKESEPQTKGPLSLRWLGVSVARADESQAQSHRPEEEIRQALETYRQAYEKQDLAMLENVYATFTPTQRQANTEYFQNTQNLRVAIHDVVISVSGNEAAVSYTREDEFRDAKTGQKVKLDARFTKIFVRTNVGWRMSLGKKEERH
jgi:TolB-like protein/ketosteroid isomerase-like protein